MLLRQTQKKLGDGLIIVLLERLCTLLELVMRVKPLVF